jgi:hypothetical protein
MDRPDERHKRGRSAVCKRFIDEPKDRSGADAVPGLRNREMHNESS